MYDEFVSRLSPDRLASYPDVVSVRGWDLTPRFRHESYHPTHVPSTVTSLSIRAEEGARITSFFGGLPPSVTDLSISVPSTLSFTVPPVPATVARLSVSCGYAFQFARFSSLPDTLRLLRWDYWNSPFRKTLSPPSSLVSLTLGEMQRDRIDVASLPRTLRTLAYRGDSFFAEDVTDLPPSLTCLQIPFAHLDPVKLDLLPRSITNLGVGKIGGRLENLPHALVAFSIGECEARQINDATFPIRLESLRVSDLRNKHAVQVTFPPTLRALCVWTYVMDDLNRLEIPLGLEKLYVSKTHDGFERRIHATFPKLVVRTGWCGWPDAGIDVHFDPPDA